MINENEFDIVVGSQRKWYELNLKEVYKYRDLIFLLVKRNFTSQYKQTILGPAWFIINPLVSSFVSTIVFSNIAHIESDGIPYFLFYLSGYVIWNYFTACVNNTSATFTMNAGIMGKVYFPRLTMPISSVVYSAINMMIVFSLTVITQIVYAFLGVDYNIGWSLLLIPAFMIQTALLGLGVGIIVASLTTKYRDLVVLVGFGLSLWMYLTPVVYPVSFLGEQYARLVMINPMAPIINNFKYALLGVGNFEVFYWILSLVVTGVVLLIGIMLFNKTEKTFMDTV